MADAQTTPASGDTVRIHPWVTYVSSALLLLGSLGILITSPDARDELGRSPEMAAARNYFERNPDIEISGLLAQWIGPDEIKQMRADHEARRQAGGVAILSARMQEKTQKRFDAIQREAFASLQQLPSWRFGVVDGSSPIQNTFLHVAVHDSLVAIVVSMLFFVLTAITLEGAWGSLLFGGFCFLLPIVVTTTHTSFYGDRGVPWVGASGVVAGLLGAYLVRSFKGFTIPGWLLLPAWIVAEYLFARDLSIDHFDAAPVVVHGVSFAFGAASAAAIWVLGLEEKLAVGPRDTPDLVANPLLDQALQEQQDGNPEGAFELLEPELRRAPGNHDVALALWQVSSGSDRARRAIPAMLGAVRDALRSNRRDDACSLWTAMVTETSDLPADGTLLVRIAEALLAREEHEAALHAFARAVDGSRTLSSGLAIRVVRGARDLDPDLAGRAASVALSDEQLGLKERQELQAVADASGRRAGAGAAAAGEKTRPAPVSTPAAAPKPAASPTAASSPAPAPGAAPSAPPVAAVPPPAAAAEPEPDPFQDPHAIALDAFEELGTGESLAAEDPNTWNEPGLVTDLSHELEDDGPGFDWSGLQDEETVAAPAPPVAASAPPVAASAPPVAASAPPVAADAPSSAESATEPTLDTAVDLDGDRGAAASGSTDVSETTETLEPRPRVAAPVAPEVPPAAAPASPPVPEPAPAEPAISDLDDLDEAALASVTRRSLRARPAVPVALDEEGLSIEVEGGGKTVLPYGRIEAVAAGAVRGLADKPVLVVDVVLNWLAVPDEPLKVVRLRSDTFDPRRIVPDKSSALEALRAMLDQLIARSGATPLPGRDAALGHPFTSFPDLASYDRTVLMVG